LERTNNEANNCVIIISGGGLCGNETGASDEDDESEALASVEHRGESQEELSRNVTPQRNTYCMAVQKRHQPEPRRTLVRILLNQTPLGLFTVAFLTSFFAPFFAPFFPPFFLFRR
jgi:hypothetical protein